MVREAARGLILLAVASSAAAQDPGTVLRANARQWERLIAAENARAPTAAQRAEIMRAAHSREPELRRLAVRALGRLERATLADSIAPFLRDASPRVRVEAAHALGRALSEPNTQNNSHVTARRQLTSSLSTERDASVISAIAETLGRSRHSSATQARGTLGTLLPLLDRSGTVALGAARGLYFLVRQEHGRAAVNAATRAALVRKAASRPSGPSDPDAARVRALAAASLIAADTSDIEAASLSAILRDPDMYVRRQALFGLATTMRDSTAVETLVLEAMADSSGVVRYEALRVFGRRLARARGCEPVIRATNDTSSYVALSAIDLLGRVCRNSPAAVALLDSLTGTLPINNNDGWHRAAHALVSLARVAPDSARKRFSSFTAHPSNFVRSYVAEAANTSGDTAVLKGLAGHAHPNVRTAAVQGLNRLLGRGADSIFVAQLDQDDGQLLLAVTEALDSTPRADAVPALLNALDRVSSAKRETSRDPRVALIGRVRSLGNASLAERLSPYLRDFDPVVAESAAAALQQWTGRRPQIRPAQLANQKLPTFEEAAALARARAVIQLADGSEIELELLPFDAPANTERFARLARAGYFDGTTFHRVVPNYVVQGGSPFANEFAGDGPFTRDEVGIENRRGTVGLSTRGRDTGDAQIFINLVDNVRLDHEYTVFARVVKGMENVDRMLEGATMRKVLIR
jgi:cyclophilin family peptidyl-prolyl cis-trans isomerase